VYLGGLRDIEGSKEKHTFAKESGTQSNIGPSPIQEATIARAIEMRKQASISLLSEYSSSKNKSTPIRELVYKLA
jgi:hypothetical protein